MTRALVTGFEPFGGADVNPSQLLVEALTADPPEGVELVHAVLPVSYGRAAAALRDAVRAADPQLVVCFGLADGDSCISVERFAHNLDDAGALDNDGVPASAGPIDPSGPLAYATTLPVTEIVAALEVEEIPATPSRDAGGYLCNHAFYVLMRLLEQERPATRGGFVHVPSLDAIPLEKLVQAGRIVLQTA
jgi:pyroglutamyl-peptidase